MPFKAVSNPFFDIKDDLLYKLSINDLALHVDSISSGDVVILQDSALEFGG